MQLPKKVNISGKTYTVIKDHKEENSSGRTFKQQMTIGIKGQGDERQFDMFLHETAELITCERNYRYGEGSSETSIFVMNHKDFEHFISDLATAIMPIIKR